MHKKIIYCFLALSMGNLCYGSGFAGENPRILQLKKENYNMLCGKNRTQLKSGLQASSASQQYITGKIINVAQNGQQSDFGDDNESLPTDRQQRITPVVPEQKGCWGSCSPWRVGRRASIHPLKPN